MQMKVTTLPDGAQAQYIMVRDGIGAQWVSNFSKRLKSKRPADAQVFTPSEAMKAYQALVDLGYKGLSLTNALPEPGDELKNQDAALALCHELEDWCKGQKLPYERADDLAKMPFVTKAQKDWLADFGRRWDNRPTVGETLSTNIEAMVASPEPQAASL